MNEKYEKQLNEVTLEVMAPSDAIYDLVSELRSHGIEVSWIPIDESRNEFVEAVSATIVAAGSYDIIKAVLTKLRDRMIKLSMRKGTAETRPEHDNDAADRS